MFRFKVESKRHEVSVWVFELWVWGLGYKFWPQVGCKSVLCLFGLRLGFPVSGFRYRGSKSCCAAPERLQPDCRNTYTSAQTIHEVHSLPMYYVLP